MQGHYRTANNSDVWITKSGFRTSFDWYEEPSACDSCEVEEVNEGYLYWNCEECGGGSAKLNKEKEDAK